MPGENPNSPSLDDAVHWVVVYRELNNLLAESGIDPSSEHRARYRRRLDFWRGRLRELSNGGASTTASSEIVK